jgi:hypothetical protein
VYEESEPCLQEFAINGVSEAVRELLYSKVSWEHNISADLIWYGGLQLWREKQT